MAKPENYQKLGLTDFLMLLVTIIWAINLTMIKLAFREFPPLGFNAIRFVLATLVLLAVLKLSGEGFDLERKDVPRIIGLGLVGTTLYQLLFLKGISISSASSTSIVLAMTPIFIALFSSVFRYEKIPAAGWLGILISFIGFYFVISGQNGSLRFSLSQAKGDIFVFFGNICWAAFTVFSKPLLERISPLKLASLTTVSGTLFYLPFTIGTLNRMDWTAISIGAWAALFYSAFLAICLCFVIWYTSVKRVGNSRTGVYNNLTPIFAVVFAYFVLAERIRPFQAVGAAIILLGVYLTRSGYRLFEKRAVRGAIRQPET